jgi:hypothetical protein
MASNDLPSRPDRAGTDSDESSAGDPASAESSLGKLSRADIRLYMRMTTAQLREATLRAERAEERARLEEERRRALEARCCALM